MELWSVTLARVRVVERGRERERSRERGRERSRKRSKEVERDRERESVCVCVCVCDVKRWLPTCALSLCESQSISWSTWTDKSLTDTEQVRGC